MDFKVGDKVSTINGKVGIVCQVGRYPNEVDVHIGTGIDGKELTYMSWQLTKVEKKKEDSVSLQKGDWVKVEGGKIGQISIVCLPEIVTKYQVGYGDGTYSECLEKQLTKVEEPASRWLLSEQQMVDVARQVPFTTEAIAKAIALASARHVVDEVMRRNKRQEGCSEGWLLLAPKDLAELQKDVGL